MNIDPQHLIDIEKNRTSGPKRKRRICSVFGCCEPAHGSINNQVMCDRHYSKAYMRAKRARDKVAVVKVEQKGKATDYKYVRDEYYQGEVDP